MSDIDNIVNNVISTVRHENAKNSARVSLRSPRLQREYIYNTTLPRYSITTLDRPYISTLDTIPRVMSPLSKSYREVDLELKKAALESSLNTEKKNKESLNFYLNLEINALKDKNKALEVANSRLRDSLDKEKL